MRLWHTLLLIATGTLAGAASALNYLAQTDPPTSVSLPQLATTILIGITVFTILLLSIHWTTHKLLARLPVSATTRQRFANYDALSCLIFLCLFAGAFGLQVIGPIITSILLAWILLKAALLYFAASPSERQDAFTSLSYLAFLFLISGFAALIYQIVWQRALFAAFGVNIESIVVSLFMFGLGVGSLVGGYLSSRFPANGPLLFLACELGIGAFGIVSLPLIASVSAATIHTSLATTALAVYALLCLPTMLMGATLPILVAHLHRYYHNVGQSVGLLYCINTLGSAIACFLTAELLFFFFGEHTAVLIAAACNLTVGILVSIYARRVAKVTHYQLSTTN
jgi:hypothetical protein